ncbi:hypothetical protein FOZ62_016540 [Perkinsus olseni]|uniref:Uncharacterized protein n=1 Tax=Perkinsus olseni TaxID=32597 RepID=A0A7J6QFD5_PEROL|nr:hypothetical protein FOZ62_016540 [Perkinsus olseni]
MTGLYSAGATFKDAVTKRYAELPEGVQKAYGEGHLHSVREALTGSLYGVLSNKDRSKVSEAMEHALLSPSPNWFHRYRYRVGIDSKTMYLLSFLPEWLRDTVFELLPKWVLGLDVAPPAHAPKDGLSIAKSRYHAPTKRVFMVAILLLLLLSSLLLWAVLRVVWH